MIFAPHLNGNLLCAVDTETTGLIPGYHEAIQVAVVPVTANLEMAELPPFYVDIKVQHVERIQPAALRINRINIPRHQMTAMDPIDAAGYFDEWFQKIHKDLKMEIGKKIVPLAQNWSFDKYMLMHWLGFLPDMEPVMDHFFTFEYKDLKPITMYLNDVADNINSQYPFPKKGLGSIAKRLNVQRDNAHNALGDCIDLIRCYKKICRLHTDFQELTFY